MEQESQIALSVFQAKVMVFLIKIHQELDMKISEGWLRKTQ